jgi:adhesin transport system outer membrane protein
MKLRRNAFGAVALLMAAGAACAQTSTVASAAADPLRHSVETAVNTNPDVTARFNAYRASVDAVDVARSGFLPHLDLAASVGRGTERFNTNSLEADQTLNGHQVGLNLTQLLWDGLGTQSDVNHFGHERLARYFELRDVTEQTALEAARAHFDVQRYRRLVQLAEDNYVQHRYAYLQIQSRFKAGVGRGVDLEQAGARVALAESNLSTEVANLHDVTARYQRVVGITPPKDLPTISMLRVGMPASQAEAMNLAVRQSAAVSAAIETLRSARSSTEGRRSAYQPRVEAHLRGAVGQNVDGLFDQNRNTTAEVVLNWNLYSGGADQARIRQQTNLLSQAADLRDKTCRDTRQTAAIAYNDTRKLADQLVYLDRNTLAIEKARDAYRQQFDIGQRSLLDLLNAENEVYTARRAYANAEYDLGFAFARTHAAMNQLSVQLGVAQIDNVANDASGWEQGEDAPTRCPVLVAEVIAVDHDELDARAARMAESAPKPVSPVPMDTPNTPVTPAQKP